MADVLGTDHAARACDLDVGGVLVAEVTLAKRGRKVLGGVDEAEHGYFAQ